MKCLYYQGKMKKGETSVHLDRKDYHLTLHSVPAWVCSQCGENYFAEKQVEKIQRVLQAIDQKIHITQ